MTKNQERALAALVSNPTIKAAAAAAGIDYRTMRRYMDDPDFMTEYRHITTEMLQDARMRSQQLLNPALEALAEIFTNAEAKDSDRIAAARGILEWGTKLTELTDIAERVEMLENEHRSA